MLEFECLLCGETHERPETGENSHRIDHDHSSLFCDEHSSEEVENYIQRQMDGGRE